MCFVVKSKIKWKFNIFPKTVYKFVRKLDDKQCESFWYLEKYRLNELKKVSFKKIESCKEPYPVGINYDNYSIGLHYYTSFRECEIQFRLAYGSVPESRIVKCIIPSFSLRKENGKCEGITNKLKIVKFINKEYERS